MAIRKANDSGRIQLRLTGTETFHEVAMRLFADERVIPMLRKANPGVKDDPPRAGTTLSVPSKAEAQAFAKANGFALGYDPAKGGSTKAKRNWKRLKDGAQKKNGDIDPGQLASLFETQKLAPDVAARRMIALIPDAMLVPFLEAEGKSEFADSVAEEVETLRLRAIVKAAVKALATVLERTIQPRGARLLATASAEHAAATENALKELLVVEALRRDLIQKLGALDPLLDQARTLSTLEAVTREVSLQGNPNGGVLTVLAQAIADGVEPLDGDRLESVDIHRQVGAFHKHIGQIVTTLERVLPTIDRAPRHVVHAAANGDETAEIPRPWPVIVKLIDAFAERLDAIHPGRLDDGIACLLLASPAPDSPSAATSEGDSLDDAEAAAAPVLSAAELVSRAAHNAKVADDHDSIPHRLAPTVCALFDAFRPTAPDRGPDGQVRQRRKARYEGAILGAKGATLNGDVIASIVDDVLSAARDSESKQVVRYARRLTPAARKGAKAIALQRKEPVHLLLRSASDVGVALVLAAVALDPELGPTLARPSGIEAAERLLDVHLVRILTLSAQRYLSPSSS